MTHPEPASDLSRTEKKSFRKMVKTLVDRGIDPETRAGLIDEYVRIESRLADLRATEKQSETGSKMAASRAVNVATAERRRLHDAIFKGAAKVKRTVAAAARDAASETDPDEAVEAWRAYHWKIDRRTGASELEARYGRCPINAILYASRAEELATKEALKASSRRNLNASQLADIRSHCGHRLAHELRAPMNYKPEQDALNS